MLCWIVPAGLMLASGCALPATARKPLPSTALAAKARQPDASGQRSALQSTPTPAHHDQAVILYRGNDHSWSADGDFPISRSLDQGYQPPSMEYEIFRLPPVEEEIVEVSFWDQGFDFLATIREDYGNYYSRQPMLHMLAAFGIGAAIANSNADESIQDWLEGSSRIERRNTFNSLIGEAKFFGEGGWRLLPIYAGICLTGSFFEEGTFGSGIGHWGERSLRTMIVGVPPMLLMQYVTGASRPGEADSGSAWRPFEDTNGVSGHSFMGAVPFLCAAQMVEHRGWKLVLLAGSTLTAFSRISDGDHYFSQAFLGWTMAAIAASAVDETYTGGPWRLFPWTSYNAVGIGVSVDL